MLPEDHAAGDLIGRSGADLQRVFGRAPDFLADQERGLLRIGAQLGAVPDRARQDAVRLGRGVAAAIGGGSDEISSFLPRVSSGLGRTAERELRGTRRLTSGADAFVERFGRDVSRLRRSALEMPDHLHLSRDIMPMPTDRERTVDLDPPARRRTLLERLLDRMSL